MKKIKYTGTFINHDGDTYHLDVYCNGFIKATILLTAEAIKLDKHYQLDHIINENGNKRTVGDILIIDNILL